MTLAKGHLHINIRSIFLETDLPIKIKFYLEPPLEGRNKVCINGSGYISKMAVKAVNSKTITNFLFLNQFTDSSETW